MVIIIVSWQEKKRTCCFVSTKICTQIPQVGGAQPMWKHPILKYSTWWSNVWHLLQTNRFLWAIGFNLLLSALNNLLNCFTNGTLRFDCYIVTLPVEYLEFERSNRLRSSRFLNNVFENWVSLVWLLLGYILIFYIRF